MGGRMLMEESYSPEEATDIELVIIPELEMLHLDSVTQEIGAWQ